MHAGVFLRGHAFFWLLPCFVHLALGSTLKIESTDRGAESPKNILGLCKNKDVCFQLTDLKANGDQMAGRHWPAHH